MRLRKASAVCSTVSVSIKDPYMQVIQRQRPLCAPTDICKEISECAMSIIRDSWEVGKPVRSITVTALNLAKKRDSGSQVHIFNSRSSSGGQDRGRARSGEVAVDAIRQKWGAGSIVRGANIDNDIGIYDPKSTK